MTNKTLSSTKSIAKVYWTRN